MIDYPILTHTNLYKIEDFLMSKDTDKLSKVLLNDTVQNNSN